MPTAEPHPLRDLASLLRDVVKGKQSLNPAGVDACVQTALAWLDLRLSHPVRQRGRVDVEALGHRVDRAALLEDEAHCFGLELWFEFPSVSLRHSGLRFSRKFGVHENGAGSHWAMHNIQAGQDSLRRSCARMMHAAASGRVDLAEAEARLLSAIAQDLFVFFPPAMNAACGRPIDSVAVKRTLLNSTETFRLAQMLMRREVRNGFDGDYAALPTAATLLRQTCELRLKNMFGIDTVEQPDGRPLKLRSDFFLQHAKANRKRLHVPVPLDVLGKIYDWANETVHAGVVPRAWQVDLAVHLMAPMMGGGGHGNLWSAHGAIWVKQSVVDGIEGALQRYYEGGKIREGIVGRAWRSARASLGLSPPVKGKLVIVKRRPEAAVVDEDYDGSGPGEKMKRFQAAVVRLVRGGRPSP